MNLQPDRPLLRSLFILLCFASLLCSGCSAVQRQPRIAEPISSITPGRCKQELSSFLELGSRACWKPEETAVTIDFLTRKLEGWGYQVIRESLDLPRYPGNANLIVEKVKGRIRANKQNKGYTTRDLDVMELGPFCFCRIWLDFRPY